MMAVGMKGRTQAVIPTAMVLWATTTNICNAHHIVDYRADDDSGDESTLEASRCSTPRPMM